MSDVTVEQRLERVEARLDALYEALEIAGVIVEDFATGMPTPHEFGWHGPDARAA